MQHSIICEMIALACCSLQGRTALDCASDSAILSLSSSSSISFRHRLLAVDLDLLLITITITVIPLASSDCCSNRSVAFFTFSFLILEIVNHTRNHH